MKKLKNNLDSIPKFTPKGCSGFPTDINYLGKKMWHNFPFSPFPTNAVTHTHTHRHTHTHNTHTHIIQNEGHRPNSDSHRQRLLRTVYASFISLTTIADQHTRNLTKKKAIENLMIPSMLKRRFAVVGITIGVNVWGRHICRHVAPGYLRRAAVEQCGEDGVVLLEVVLDMQVRAKKNRLF